MKRQTKFQAFWREHKHTIINLFLLFTSVGIVLTGMLTLVVATVKIPDFSSFDKTIAASSTKIYDRTGAIVLYDTNQDVKRTAIAFADMSDYSKKATVAIEDSSFYTHHGIRITSIIRALIANLLPGGGTQGGSTITQQVVKMTLLSPEKTIVRKLKEWVLAIKLDASMPKDDILALYLNEAPYGGTTYGIEEAAQEYFGKDDKDLTLGEAAYLAAIPQSPTYYSPYGSHKADLDKRKDLVLSRMRDTGVISESEYQGAEAEKVIFLPQTPSGIKAPHFVFYVKNYLEQKYGADMVANGGLKVTTTLDYTIQQQAEAVVAQYAASNETNFNATNEALVAIDPKTGDILSMVGSRGYFDKTIDGNYNIALAERQPGSAFKPFVYVTAFEKGYTPNTVLFDVPTEFQTTCDPYGKAYPGNNQADCYMPQNYDGLFRGPMSIRDALAQSINVPAVKTLYLVGIGNAIKTAQDMGITSLADPSRYGLTLVLGGGEVSLLDMTSAYSVFANEGVRNPYQSILKVEDGKGTVLEQEALNPQTVLPKNDALMISDILSDNVARTPLEGANSPLYFGGRDVAAKTGTTNDYKDVWTIGYTPSLAVGMWAGNNDNTPMAKKISGTIIAPLWHAFMSEELKTLPVEQFEKPIIPDDPQTLKPIIRGIWQGGQDFFVDSVSGKLATANTPKEDLQEKVITDVHSILYWVNKSDPLGPSPANPEQDPQFKNWEVPVRAWWQAHAALYPVVTAANKPIVSDDIHTPENAPKITITSPQASAIYAPNQRVTISITSQGRYPLAKADLFINNDYLGTIKNPPFTFSFVPSDVDSILPTNDIKIVAYDSVSNSTEVHQNLSVSSN